MVYLTEEEIYTAYQESSDEADQWRIDYPQYERLADNGLLEDLDENLPEVNDGSLAASLFKLAKRVIKKKLGGQAVSVDREEAWITKLANIYWEKKIIPNARSKASPRSKWKDAVRKAAIYGGQPIITLFLTRGSYTGSDFIVPYAQDVKLEAGKDSAEDSDVIFWDVYYSKLQIKNMIDQAKEEMKDAGTPYVAKNKDTDPETVPVKTTTSAKATTDSTDTEDQNDSTEQSFNKWDIDALQTILDGDAEEQRPGNQTPRAEQGSSGTKKTGYHFFIAFQRGVEAPFMMCHAATNQCIREWNNTDPTGDVPVHYLYCYQDFVNPYGIGIVKLAGGTQNVLDYMRQADILATQVGISPPKLIQGDEDQVDEDSMVMSRDANWYIGNAKVTPWNMANGVYEQLPGRINMYQTSLQKIIPTGDTSISGATSGDSTVSKTPAGVNLAAANLSIDDEDFSENVDEAYAAVARSMINIQFANMQGTDLLKLSDDEQDSLEKSGLEFPANAHGVKTKELNITWDNARATFEFEIDPSTGDDMSDADQVAILQEVVKTVDLPTNYYLAQDGWKYNAGEAYYALLSKLHLENFNDIITKMTPEEKAQAAKQPFPIIDPPQIRLTGQIPSGAMPSALASGGVNLPPNTPLGADQQEHTQAMDKAKLALEVHKVAQTPAPVNSNNPSVAPGQLPEVPANPNDPNSPENQTKIAEDHINQVMKLYKVDAHTAAAMLEAERQGYSPKEILSHMKRATAKSPVKVTNVK